MFNKKIFRRYFYVHDVETNVGYRMIEYGLRLGKNVCECKEVSVHKVICIKLP